MVRDNQEIEGSAELRFDMDMSTFNDTKVGGLSDAGTLQFPAGFFNTPQLASQTTAQFSTAITQVNATNFAPVIATTVSPRLLQFGLRCTF